MATIAQALNLLEGNQLLKITPIGCSMCPFFYGGRDDVYLMRPTFPLKRGEIALFKRKSENRYVIHRIHHIDNSSSGRQYFMLGDNQTWLEGPITEAEIEAVAVQIMRKGRLIDCRTNHFYRFTSKLWLVMRPIRPFFINLWIRFKRTGNSAENQAILNEIKNKQ